jgi:replicative DNA helicase
MDAAAEVERLSALYSEPARDQGRPGMRAQRVDQLRVPPQAIEAEQAVLGGLMLLPRAWYEVCDLISAADFYRRDHALIWEGIAECIDRKRPVDAVTLGDWFEARGEGELVSGGAYLIDLASTTPSAANIRAYAEIVADKSRLRRVIEAGTELVNSGFVPDGRDSLEIIGEAQARLGALVSNQPCELESVTPVMQRVFDRLQERYHRGGGVNGVTTGIDDLDQLLNGLVPGGLYLLAARPKMGKTTLAQNIAEHIALERQLAVAVFSFEMQPEELGDRMLSSLGDVDADRVRRGELDEADWANVTAAMRRLRGAKIFVSRPRNARVEHVVAQARRQHAQSRLGLVVIDYLQLMHTTGDNRAQGIGEITRALKLMAGELGIPVLLLSQLNRDLEKRPDKRPMPSDLRDSGAIEQDADAVIFIYRDEIYDRASRYRGTAEIIVGLQRNGPADTVRVRYRPDRFRFENLPDDWEPESLPPANGEGRTERRGFRKRGNTGADAAAGDA